MIDALPDPPDLNPSNLSTSHFTRVRRGFEPTEVNALLGRSADALRTWEERDARLVERLEELERKLAESHELDEERITTVLGEETARIIAVAREAAAEMRATAEAESAALVDEAERTSSARAEALVNESAALRAEAATERDEAREEASLLRQQAIDETVAARSEAEEAAAALRSAASAEATRLRDEARAEADRLTSEATRRHDEMLAEAAGVLEERTSAAEAAAAAIRETADAELALARDESARIRAEAEAAGSEEVERARSVGRDMVGEARDVRERMLRDLAEKRKKSRQHIEAARAGRARIIESLREANEAVAGIVGELADNDRAVTRAADDAASGVVDDVDLVVAELEATLMSEEALAPLPGDAPSGSDDGDSGDDDSEGAEVDEAAGDAAIEDASVADAAIEEVDGGGTEVDAQPVPDAPADHATADEPPDAATDRLADAVIDTAIDTVIDDVSDAEAGPEAGGQIAEAPAPADPVGDDDGPGATVHDLFARIRADVDEPVAAEVITHSVDVSAVASTDGQMTEVVEVVEVTEVTEVVEAAGSAGPSTDATAADPAVAALNRRDELLAGPEKALGRLLKRAVSDEQNEVLDSLRRTPKRSRPELDSLLPVDQLNRLSHSLRPDFDAAVAAGAEFWTETTHGSATSLLGLADDPGVGEALNGRVSDLLALRSLHLRRTLEEAEAEGLDVTELADRIRSAYRDWRASAVPELAGDLAIAGFAEGVRKAAGPGAMWCWVADNGGLPCSDAEDNSLAGGITAGDKFPTGDTLPPAHAGCRCILLPAPQ